MDAGQVDDRWQVLLTELRDRFGQSLGIEGILFLVGVQEAGQGYDPQLEKEQKQHLIMLGSYHVMTALGLYQQSDTGGWRRTSPWPEMDVEEQEQLLRVGILRYFEARNVDAGT